MLSPPVHSTPGGQAYPGLTWPRVDEKSCSAMDAFVAAVPVKFEAGFGTYDPSLQMKPSMHGLPPESSTPGLARMLPRVQKCPDWHSPVGAVRPWLPQYCPCKQAVQSAVSDTCSMEENVPTKHCTSTALADLAGHTRPAGQGDGFIVVPGQKYPAGQSVHTAAPVVFENVRATQLSGVPDRVGQ